MKRFVEYEKEAEVPLRSSKPDSVYVWYAYKNGKLVAESKVSREDAERLGGTKIVEKVEKNKEEQRQWQENFNNRYQAAVDAWYSDLEKEYYMLDEEVFAVCYDYAYDRGHSSGYDEVAEQMEHYAIFAERVIDLSQKGLGK